MRAPKTSAQELAAALERSEARFHALVDHAGFGLFRATADGRRLLDVNEALVEMLGYDDAAPLLETDIRDLVIEPGEHARVLARASTPDFFEWIETRIRKHDGTPITMRVAVRAVADASGKLVEFEGIAEDITERRRQEELLRRTERMASIGTTLAGVAHELNNPLAAILGFTQLLLERNPGPDARTALETISHEAERCARIVKDLLFLARKREEEQRGEVDVNDVVGYIVRTRRYALETSGVGCELHLKSTLPCVYADRAQLEQVVLNLLTNAENALRSHPAADGRITVRTRADDRHVILEVEDNGPGIPPSERARIWDPFYTTREDADATGLGLSLVHHIVNEHGGTIVADDVTPHGVCFRVTLPVIPEVVPTPREQTAERALDVLVVSAGAEESSFLTRFLTSRGHATLAAGDVDRARRLASHTTFDAVVLQAPALPEAGSTVAALRGVPGCANARFVVAVEQSSGTGRASPGVTVLTKPYDVEALRRAVEEG